MFGERLRVARARARLTLRDVGREIEVSAQMVKKYEDGNSMPSSSKFIKLCEILDVSAEWLFDPAPLDFQSTETAPQGRHAKYWVREALDEILERFPDLRSNKDTGDTE